MIAEVDRFQIEEVDLSTQQTGETEIGFSMETCCIVGGDVARNIAMKPSAIMPAFPYPLIENILHNKNRECSPSMKDFVIDELETDSSGSYCGNDQNSSYLQSHLMNSPSFLQEQHSEEEEEEEEFEYEYNESNIEGDDEYDENSADSGCNSCCSIEEMTIEFKTNVVLSIPNTRTRKSRFPHNHLPSETGGIQSQWSNNNNNNNNNSNNTRRIEIEEICVNGSSILKEMKPKQKIKKEERSSQILVISQEDAQSNIDERSLVNLERDELGLMRINGKRKHFQIDAMSEDYQNHKRMHRISHPIQFETSILDFEKNVNLHSTNPGKKRSLEEDEKDDSRIYVEGIITEVAIEQEDSQEYFRNHRDDILQSSLFEMQKNNQNYYDSIVGKSSEQFQCFSDLQLTRNLVSYE